MSAVANPQKACRNAQTGPTASRPLVRAGIYVRKSIAAEAGEALTSLEVQRGRVEAYVQAHAEEGWVALPQAYADDGWSGANLQRPAFQRLLRDVEAGLVDVVAVYRFDRLSRSQLDLLSLVNHFQERGVRFLSVTEQLDTTTIMGRAMLGVMASFAQMERETIAERTRDKMSASRKMGLWQGGRVVLGYEVADRKLVVVPDQASQVRDIFRLYLELESYLPVLAELRKRGWKNQTGNPFDKNALARLLTNPIYIGKVRCGQELYAGQHEAIVDRASWDAVQAQLRAHQHARGREGRNRWGMLLKGLLRCGACAATMGHHYTAKGVRRYSYYLCGSAQKQGADVCRGSRVAAAKIEAAVVERIRRISSDPALVEATVAAAREEVAVQKVQLEAELRRLEQERRRLESEQRNLADAVAQGGAGTPALRQRLGEVEEALQDATARAQAVLETLKAAKAAEVDEAELRGALAAFGPVWDELFPMERARILGLLLERVVYDGRSGEVVIKFKPGGALALAAEGAR